MTIEKSPEKQKALQTALAQIEKQFGKGSIMKFDSDFIEPIEVISTGSLGLDVALGVGGLPRGRIVEIYGPESSGKTTDVFAPRHFRSFIKIFSRLSTNDGLVIFPSVTI